MVQRDGYRSSEAAQPDPVLKRIEVKHFALSTSSILCCFLFSYLLRLSFAYFCCSLDQVMNSHESPYLMKMMDQTSTWQRRREYCCVPKLDFGLKLVGVRLQQKQKFRQLLSLHKGTSSINRGLVLAQLAHLQVMLGLRAPKQKTSPHSPKGVLSVQGKCKPEMMFKSHNFHSSENS